MKENFKPKLILDLLKQNGPMKISEISAKLKSMGYKITQDSVSNYFWSKNYRLIDKLEKFPKYKYGLKKD